MMDPPPSSGASYALTLEGGARANRDVRRIVNIKPPFMLVQKYNQIKI
jgi:hypothetical protein